MAANIITLSLLIVAIIHLLPLIGLIGVPKLESLYQVSIQGNDMAILMRHRAVLFGLLGAFLVYAAFKPGLQPIAFVAAAVSMLSFLWLAWSTGDYNPAIRKVVIADVVALVALVVAIGAYFLAEASL